MSVADIKPTRASLIPLCTRRFYHGCSTFLPVFDAGVDTYDELHERSPFAVDCICMVAAKVRDGGGECPHYPRVGYAER